MEKKIVEVDCIDIDFILNQDDVKNVICIEANKPNLDLFAQAFYDIYIKG